MKNEMTLKLTREQFDIIANALDCSANEADRKLDEMYSNLNTYGETREKHLKEWKEKSRGLYDKMFKLVYDKECEEDLIIENVEKATKEGKRFAVISGKPQFITNEQVEKLDKVADNHMLDEDTYYYGVSTRCSVDGKEEAKYPEIFQFGYGR